LFTYTSLYWIYEGFYHKVNGVTVKRVPEWIGEYLTPSGLAHWIMLNGTCWEGHSLNLAGCFTYKECKYLARILKNSFNLKTNIIKAESNNDLCWKISIPAESMQALASIIGKHLVPEMYYKLYGDVNYWER